MVLFVTSCLVRPVTLRRIRFRQARSQATRRVAQEQMATALHLWADDGPPG
jgi:hypothetical protein